MTNNQMLIDAVRRLPAAELQNRLLQIPDRELALAMLYLGDSDKNRILSSMGNSKGNRVGQELSYCIHLRITRKQQEQALLRVVDSLQVNRRHESVKSYLRPVRSGGGRFTR
jgi:hypothetical protein